MPCSQEKPDKRVTIRNSGNIIEFFSPVVPKNNPDFAIDDISNALDHAGVFQDIKKD